VENFRDLSERGLIMATIRKRGKGYQIDYCDPDGKRVRKSFKKKKDAQAELGKRVSLIAEGRYLDVKKEYKTTLEKLLAKYTENHQHQASYKTGKRHYLENFRDYFGESTLLANIKYMHLETYRNHLRQKITKNKTIRADASVNREMSCLHHIFTKAAEWEMIEQNPFDKGKSLILKENNKRMRFLTEDEIRSLLENCPPYLYKIVECALNSGMRRGEILSLKWSQVRNGFLYLRQTKTSESRQIPINDSLELMFKQIKSEQNPKGHNVIRLNGKPVKSLKSEDVFTYRGEPVKEVKRSFKTAVKDAEIQDFRFHDLRHTFASQVLMKGGTLKDVQELLGHKTMTMTLRYAHLTQEHKRKAVNLLNGLTAPKSDDCHKTVTFPVQEKSASL
jgi:integrase